MKIPFIYQDKANYILLDTPYRHTIIIIIIIASDVEGFYIETTKVNKRVEAFEKYYLCIV